MVERIGSYQILSEIGRGGFGRVYRAHDTAVGRDVAIKILSEEADPDLLGRFRSEASTTANLRHNNIVTLYGYGEHEGMPYLVMELLEGENLQSVIEKKSPLSLLQKVSVMTKVAEGLQAAHQSGVIHRDVKPANIMILRDGTVKIMDFGIARVTSRDTVRRTRQGFLVGTISYMAPEQFQTTGEADICGDIFAFGDVYYELLTGVHPFHGNDPASIMFKITSVEPPPVRDLVPDCPESLEFVIHRALAKDRVMRYQSMEDLLFDTEPVLLELKHQRAQEIVTEAQQLVTAKDFKTAQVKVREVLELEPFNREARLLRELLNQRVQQEAMRARIEILVKDGDERFSQKRWAEAVERFESVLKINKSDAYAQIKLGEARARLDANRQALRLVMEAKQAAQQGDLTAAHRLVQNAIEVEPDNREALAFDGHVRRQLQARRMQIALQAAQQHLAAKAYPEALNALSLADAEMPGTPEVEDLRELVAKEQEEEEKRRKRQEFEQAIAKTREELKAGRLQEAARWIAQANADDDPADLRRVADLKAQIEALQKAEAMRAASEEAVDLARNQQFDAALAKLARFPGEPSLERLRQDIAARKAETEKRAAIEQAAVAAKAAVEARDFGQAVDIARKAMARFPGTRELFELRESIERAKSTHEYQEELNRVLQQAQARLGAGAPADAVAGLENSAQRFGHDRAHAELLGSARAALAAQQERRFVEASLQRIESFEAVRLWERALAEAEAGLKRFPHQKDFLEHAIRLHEEIVRQRREQALASHIAQIEGRLNSGDLRGAAKVLETARIEFPQEPTLESLTARVAQATFQEELGEAVAAVRRHLSRADFAGARRLIDGAKSRFDSEAAWREVRETVEHHENYERGLRTIEDHRRRGNLDEAESLAWDLFAANPPDDRAEQLIAILAEETAARDRQNAIASARQKAQALVESGAMQEAVEELRAAVKRFPGEPTLQSNLHRAEELLRAMRLETERRARVEAIAKVRAEATQLARNGDLARAIELLKKARAQYPEESGFAEDLRNAEARLAAERLEAERRARAEAIAKVREEAAGLVEAGKVAGAVEVLQRGRSQYPDDVGLAEDLRNAEARLAAERLEAERRARAEAIAKVREEAAGLVEAGKVAGAVEVLQRGRSQYPDDVGLAEDLRNAEARLAAERLEAERRARAEAIEKVREEAAGLVEAGKVAGAVEVLQRGRSQYPDDVGLAEDLRNAEARLAAERLEAERRARAEAIAKVREEAERLVEAGKVAGAVEVLQRGRSQYPDDVGLAEDLRNAEARLAAERLAATIAKARAEGRQLVQAGKLAEAIAFLKQARVQYPNESVLAEDLRKAEARLAEERAAAEIARVEAIASVRAEATRMIEAGKLDAAIASLKYARTQYGDQPAIVEDLRRAEERLAAERLAAAIAKIRAEGLRLVEAGQLAEAIEFLKQARGQYPHEAELAADLRNAETRLAEEAAAAETARVEAIAKVRAESRRMIEAGRLAEAVAALQQARSQYGDQPAIVEDLRRAEERLAAERLAEAIAKVRAEAARLVEARKLSGAIGVLQRGRSKYPDEPSIVEDLRLAEERLAAERLEAERAAREAAIAKARAEGRQLVLAGKLPQAIAFLKEARGRYPDEAALVEDLREAEGRLADEVAAAERARVEAIAKVRAEAARMVKGGKLEDAIALLKQSRSQYGHEPAIVEDLRRAEERLAAERLAAAIDKARADARQLVQAGKVPDAIAFLKQARGKYPDEAALAEDLRNAENRLADELAAAIAKVRAEATRMIEAGTLDAAVATLKQARSQYGDDPSIVEDLGRAERAARVEEIAKVRSEAKRLAEGGDFAGAIALLKSSKHGDEPSISSDLRTAEQGLAAQRLEAERAARSEAIAKVRADAKRLAESGDFAGAIAFLKRSKYKDESSISEDLRVAEERLVAQQLEVERAARAEAIAKVRAEAAQMIGSGDLAKAIAFLKRSKYADDGLIVQDLRRAEERLAAGRREAERARAEAISKVRAEAARLSQSGNLAGAIALLKSSQYPEELAGDLREAENRLERLRAEAIANVRKEAQQKIRAGDLAGAIALLKDQYKDELAGDLQDAERRLAAERLEAERAALAEAIAQVRAEARRLLQSGNVNGAIGVLTQARSRYPDDPSIFEDLRDAERAAHAEAILKVRTDADDMSRAGNLTGAIAFLGQARLRFPDEQSIANDLRTFEARLVAERAEAERAAVLNEINAGRSEVAALIQGGDVGAAVDRLKLMVKQYPAEQALKEELRQARELHKNARKRTKTETAEPYVPPSEPTPEARPVYKNPMVIAAGLVVLAAGGYFALRPSSTGTSVALKAEPAELTFSYQIGSPAPDALQVALGEGDAKFQAAASERWISVSPAAGTRLGPLTVTTDPRGMKAGSYQGMVRITVAGTSGQTATVPVHLEVAAAAAVKVQPESLSFSYRDGASLPPPQKITVARGKDGATALSVSVPAQDSWLIAEVRGETVNVSVKPAQMQVGEHRGVIRISRNGIQRNVPVVLNIARAAGAEVTVTTTGPAKMLRWSGSLKPGENLTLQGGSATPGQITSGSLPSEPYVVESLGGGLSIVERPAKSNGYRTRILNSGSEEETSIILRYRVAK